MTKRHELTLTTDAGHFEAKGAIVRVAGSHAPGPSIGFAAGETAVAQDVRSARPPALLENGAEATGVAFEGAPLRRRTTRVNAGLLQAVASSGHQKWFNGI